MQLTIDIPDEHWDTVQEAFVGTANYAPRRTSPDVDPEPVPSEDVVKFRVAEYIQNVVHAHATNQAEEAMRRQITEQHTVDIQVS